MNLPQTQSEATNLEGPLGAIIGRLSGVVGSENFSSGERAGLKRITPGSLPPLTFYRFAFRHLPEGWEGQQEAWMMVVAGLALMSPNPHRPARSAGRALAESGYAESRLERLLAAKEEDVLHTLLLRAVRFLAAKNESINWVDFARLLLTKDRAKLETARLSIARDYYYNLREKE